MVGQERGRVIVADHNRQPCGLWLPTLSVPGRACQNRPVEAVVAGARPRLPGLALALLGAACAALAFASLSGSGGGALTTDAAASGIAAAADLAAGLALVAAGMLAWSEPPARRLGALSVLAGCAWLGADLDGWEHGAGFVRALGAAAMPFLWALVLHLVLAAPDGRLRTRTARSGVVAAYTVAVLVSVGLTLVDDPLLDLHCWRNCVENAFLVRAEPEAADALRTVAGWAGLAVGLALVASSAWRLARATVPARRMLAPVLVPAVLAGVAETAYAIALLWGPDERPDRALFSSLFVARSVALVALATGLAISVVRARRARTAVERLAADLGETPAPGHSKRISGWRWKTRRWKSSTRSPRLDGMSMPWAGPSSDLLLLPGAA